MTTLLIEIGLKSSGRTVSSELQVDAAAKDFQTKINRIINGSSKFLCFADGMSVAIDDISFVRIRSAV